VGDPHVDERRLSVRARVFHHVGANHARGLGSDVGEIAAKPEDAPLSAVRPARISL
jgi:hypothetical protein